MWKYSGGDTDLREYVRTLNTGKRPGLVRKQEDDHLIQEAVDWDSTTTFVIGNLAKNTAQRGTWRLPSKKTVQLTPDQERFFVQRKPVGQFEAARVTTGSIHSTVYDVTGAVLVYDLEQKINGQLYYIPAQIGQPISPKTVKSLGLTPNYVHLNKDQLPSFFFWTSKSGTARETRSPAPSPDVPVQSKSLPDPPKQGAARSAHIAATAKQQLKIAKQVEAEVFDPREEEEEPTEFLDGYNVKTNGYHAIRSPMMLREEDIDRINYKSPCLSHSNKQMNKESLNIKRPIATPKKMPPIADDDPSLVAFRKKLDRREEIRQNRQQPDLVFTPEYCNESGVGATKDPQKATLTRSLYDKYWKRAKIAEQELESRSECCRACGLDWTKTSETRINHYNKHRQEYTLWLEKKDPQEPAPQPIVQARSMAPPNDGVPEIGWFNMLERLIHFYENEILERGQMCTVCDAVLDYAHVDPADHYEVHAEQRAALRAIGHAAETADPATPTVALIVSANGEVLIEEPLGSGATDSTFLTSPEELQFTPGLGHPLTQENAENGKKKYLLPPFPWDRTLPSPGSEMRADKLARPTYQFIPHISSTKGSRESDEESDIDAHNPETPMVEPGSLDQDAGLPEVIEISSDSSSSEYVSTDDESNNIIPDTPATPPVQEKSLSPIRIQMPLTPVTPGRNKRRASDSNYVPDKETEEEEEPFHIPSSKKRKIVDPTFKPRKSDDSVNSPPQTPQNLTTRRTAAGHYVTPVSEKKRVEFTFRRQGSEPKGIMRKIPEVSAGRSALKSKMASVEEEIESEGEDLEMDDGENEDLEMDDDSEMDNDEEEVVVVKEEEEYTPRRSGRLAKGGKKSYNGYR